MLNQDKKGQKHEYLNRNTKNVEQNLLFLHNKNSKQKHIFIFYYNLMIYYNIIISFIPHFPFLHPPYSSLQPPLLPPYNPIPSLQPYILLTTPMPS